jgi:DNA-binding NarL/FixJ family response regulator
VAAGLDNRQLARRLAISEATVRTHLQNIYGRLDVSSRTAAIATVFPPRPDW